MQREVDRHHHHRENADRGIDELEHLRGNRPEESAELIVDRVHHPMLARRSDNVTQRGHAVRHPVDAVLPRRHLIGQRLNQLARLIDHRRRENPPQQHQHAQRSDDRERETRALGQARVPFDQTGDRAPEQRDEDAEHQQHKNLSDRLEQPDAQDCQYRRCQDGAELEPPHRNYHARAVRGQWLFFSVMSSISAWTSSSLLPAPSAFFSGDPAGSMPIFCLRARSCMSTVPAAAPRSSCLKSCARRSPVNSSSISIDALSWRSFVSMRSSMRANASNADFSDIDDIVSAMRFCACARRWRATSRFFLRLASSILSFRSRSEFLSFSVSKRCCSHVCSSCCPCEKCSPWRMSACLARSSRPSLTASIAFCSQSCGWR